MIDAIVRVDEALRLLLTSWSHPALDAVMLGASLAGTGAALWFALAAATAIARPRLGGLMWQLVLALALTHVVTDGLLKPLLARPRPFLTAEAVRVLGLVPTTFSFPSGHASKSFAAAFVLTLAWPRARHAIWTLAALVALSRVYNGVHYPIDVVAGAGLGVGVAALVTGGRSWYIQRSAVTPARVPR